VIDRALYPTFSPPINATQKQLAAKIPSLSLLLKPKFSAAAKKRYPHVPSMARNGSLEEEFARNAEYLRLRLEFEELRRLLRIFKAPALASDPAFLPAYVSMDDRLIADVRLSSLIGRSFSRHDILTC
jgi:hypothetical protein